MIEHLEKSKVFTVCNEEDVTSKLDYLNSVGYLDFLKKVGYTTLVFADGRVLFFPESALPPGISEGDQIEILIRRIKTNEQT